MQFLLKHDFELHVNFSLRWNKECEVLVEVIDDLPIYYSFGNA